MATVAAAIKTAGRATALIAVKQVNLLSIERFCIYLSFKTALPMTTRCAWRMFEGDNPTEFQIRDTKAGVRRLGGETGMAPPVAGPLSLVVKALTATRGGNDDTKASGEYGCYLGRIM